MKSVYTQTVSDKKCLYPDPLRRQVSISRPSPMKSVYIQTVSDEKCLYPDSLRGKMSISRPSQTKSVYIQTVSDKTCLYPDPIRRKVSISRPPQTKSVYIQTFSDEVSGSRPYQREGSLFKFYIQTFVVSFCNFRAFMSRLSSIHVQIFDVSRLCNTERMTPPPRAFIFGMAILASECDLHLGRIQDYEGGAKLSHSKLDAKTS